MMRKQWWFLGGGLVVLLGGGLGLAGMRDKGLGVQIATVGRENLQAKVSANGKIQAVTKADISANVMGQVTRLAVQEGDRVQKGQFLMEIDPRSASAVADAMQASLHAAISDLASATANLTQARADYDRAKLNREAGIISTADFEHARTAYDTALAAEEGFRRRADQAKANLSQSHVGLGFSTITAPMDGVVTARRIELGETAVPGIQNQAGTVLLTISDMSKVEAEMEVDEASIPTVKLGQKAQVRIDAYPNQTLDGEVTEVGGSPILKTGTNEAIKFKVKVWIKNPPPHHQARPLRPGGHLHRQPGPGPGHPHPVPGDAGDQAQARRDPQTRRPQGRGRRLALRRRGQDQVRGGQDGPAR